MRLIIFFIIDLNVLLDKNHFKWTPLIGFQIKNITVLTRKKKFLLKEMVYSFYFHHHKHFEKNSYKVLFNFKYIKWDFLLYS